MPASTLSPGDKTALETLLGEDVSFDFLMAKRTTLRIGGPADALATPSSIDTLEALIQMGLDRRINMCAVGGGSNLLVRDGGIRGLVISTRRLRGLNRTSDVDVYVEAGVSTGKLLASATKWDLGGLEFLGGVPGSVGGGLIMNAGTYLGEFTDVATQVTSLALGTAIRKRRSHQECGFVYRGSALPADEIVVAAELRLVPRSRQDIQETVNALRKRRKEREPSGASNAGSTFKNPPGDYAGRIIEEVGLKGVRIGAAECSPQHANWLVNTGGATAQDFLSLVGLIHQKVRDVTGIELRLELKVVGEDL